MKRLFLAVFLIATSAHAQTIVPAGLPFSGGKLTGALDILGIPANEGDDPYSLGMAGGKAKFTYSPSGFTLEAIGMFVLTSPTYGAGNVADDILAVKGEAFVHQNGQAITALHTTGLYGAGFGEDATGSLAWVNGIIGVCGNEAAGTVTSCVDLRGHADLNSGGGTLTNHYFLYQETSTAAVNEYGFVMQGMSGIGTTAPTFNLDINGSPAAPLSSTNWARLGTGTGSLQVKSTGAFVFPGSSAGAGTFSANGFYVGQGTPANTGRGEIEIEKVTASGTAPGAANVKLTAVCGTGAGSAKLIMYAGTSTTPVTVVDNVGSGVTGC